MPPVSAIAEDPTHRENLLQAMGLDPSGLTGKGGQWSGNQADMIEACRWSTDLGLTEAEQIAVVREVAAKKRGGPAGSFTYFTAAMQRLAAEKAAPPLETPTLTRQPIGELQDARRTQQASEGRYGINRLNRIIGLALADD